MRLIQKALLLIWMAAFLFRATESNGQTPVLHKFAMPEINCIEAKLPVTLSGIDYGKKLVKNLPQPIFERIKNIVVEFYLDFDGDKSEEFTKIKDSYFATLRIPIGHVQLYIVMLKTPVNNMSCCKLFLYDPSEKVLSKQTVTYNTWAMYDFDRNKVAASNLKNRLPIKAPDITLEDTGKHTLLHLTRLNHNGTFNAIEKITYQLNGITLDSISLKTTVL
jgi:hypothetical protein